MNSNDECTVYCGNLNSKITEELLYELFLQGGPLKGVKLPKDHKGEPKQYAFIEYEHECSVDYAIQLFHGTSLFGQELHLQRRNKTKPGQFSPYERNQPAPMMHQSPHMIHTQLVAHPMQLPLFGAPGFPRLQGSPMFVANGIMGQPFGMNGAPPFRMPHPAEMLRSHPLPPGESSRHGRFHSMGDDRRPDHLLPTPPGESNGHHRSASYGGDQRYSSSFMKRNYQEDRRHSSDYYPDEKKSRSHSRYRDVDERRYNEQDEPGSSRHEYRERSRSYNHGSDRDERERSSSSHRGRDYDERHISKDRRNSSHRFYE